MSERIVDIWMLLGCRRAGGARTIRDRRAAHELARAHALVVVVALACLPSLALAQEEVSTDESLAEVTVPPPPGSEDEHVAPVPPPPCREGAFPTETGCMRLTTRWVWGPAPEMIGGSLGLFAVAYLVQLLSSAISIAQGEHDVGPSYSREQLDAYRDWAYLPIVGPWAKVVLQPPHVDDAGGTLFVIEGLIELGAVVWLVLSLFGEFRDETLRDVAGRWSISPRARGLAVELTF